jgi:hypothetical protein
MATVTPGQGFSPGHAFNRPGVYRCALYREPTHPDSRKPQPGRGAAAGAGPNRARRRRWAASWRNTPRAALLTSRNRRTYRCTKRGSNR